ncbi:MAG: hypothetical protein EHM58_11400 [Ignavibacteriae bacterium]|nr:MAG: hypothetical protein EHM58_11400 [Ignavibacteriota bacterium]
MYKKITFIIIVLCLFLCDILSQSIFNDALNLREAIDTKNYNAIQKILNKYPAVQCSHENNPFYKEYISNLPSGLEGLQNETKGLKEQEFVNNRAGIGYLAVDALAKLFIKRAKEYLSGIFVSGLKEYLQKEPVASLFPNSSSYLIAIGTNDENANYTNVLKFLQESYQKDITDIMYNSSNLLKDSSKIKSIVTPEIFCKYINIRKSDEAFYYFLITDVIKDLEKEKHPSEIIGKICLDPLIINNTGKFSKTIGLMSALSLSLLESNSSRNNWVEYDKFVNFFNSDTSRNIFYGLMYQKFCNDDKLKNLNYGDKKFFEYLEGIKGNTNKLDNYLKEFLDKANVLQELVTNIKNRKKEGLKIEFNDYVNYVNEVLSLINSSLKYTGPEGDNPIFENTDNIYKVVSGVPSLYENICAKNYSSAIVSSYILFKTLGFNDLSMINNDFIKYGSFLASIANATTSDDVENAIEAFALPPGSFTMKRKVSMNIGLNGYLGGFFGGGISNGTKSRMYGMTAPIGVELSTGFGCFSLGLFLPVMDIAASVSYSLINDTSQTRNDFSWNDIVSPGAYCTIGISRDFPFSLGFGVQYGPILSKFADNESAKKRIFRWSTFIALDIPLFNFYTKPKNHK